MGKDRDRDPEKTKQQSLTKDRRNSYGEAPHAARKAIPKRKAWESRSSRHQTRSDLKGIEQLDEEQQDRIESDARSDIHRVGGWKKQPDTSLGVMIQRGKNIRDRQDGKLTDDEYYALPRPADPENK